MNKKVYAGSAATLYELSFGLSSMQVVQWFLSEVELI